LKLDGYTVTPVWRGGKFIEGSAEGQTETSSTGSVGQSVLS
jgi:hypothetical protein